MPRKLAAKSSKARSKTAKPARRTAARGIAIRVRRVRASRAASGQSHAGIGSAAVLEKTGKGWNQWFAILDRAGARKWDHGRIAGFLHGNMGCPGWWSQMIAVGYEQARGMRDKHQTASGYRMSATKTLGAPVARLYRAWQDPGQRRRWLADSNFTVRKAHPEKAMRLNWHDGKTSLEVSFHDKGPARSAVKIEHSKLADSHAVDRMKKYWAAQLEKLQQLLAR